MKRQAVVSRTLSERIAQARRELGVREWRDIRRNEIAEAVGVDPSMITLYEKGSTPSEEVLVKLAAYFNVSPAYLRYGVTDEGSALASIPKAKARHVEVHDPAKKQARKRSS